MKLKIRQIKLYFFDKCSQNWHNSINIASSVIRHRPHEQVKLPDQMFTHDLSNYLIH